MKPAHHRGSFANDGAKVRAAANAHPESVCWRDGLTLTEHPPHRDGNPPKWEAGHTIDGTPGPPWLQTTRRPPAGAWLAPEASTCNRSNGAHRTNRFRANPQSQRWIV